MGFIALFIIFYLPLGMDDAVKERLSTPYDLKIYFEKRELATDETISIEKDINNDEVILEQEVLVHDLLISEDVIMVEE